MTITKCTNHRSAQLVLTLVTLLLLLAVSGLALAAPARNNQKSFATPDEAVSFLYAALQQNDDKALTALFGADAGKLINSGDPVADQADRDRFLKLFDLKNRLEQKGANRAVLYLGSDDFPFPLPLVRKGRVWFFNTKAGLKEILTRRIGKNELAVMEVLRAYLDAQREYARQDHDSNGLLEFARKLNSSPGKQDGLFWEIKAGEAPSPFGPLVAKAESEGYGTQFLASSPEPYHGYYFKILTRQGDNAAGGAFNYIVNDKMVLGFALLAYPAQYRNSGVMTFMVNQSGIIFEKDLGKESAALARQMTSFDPDSSWRTVE